MYSYFWKDLNQTRNPMYSGQDITTFLVQTKITLHDFV